MEFGFFKLSGIGGSGLLYFMCWEEFLLRFRVRGRELAKKTRRWGVSGDCDLTCQEKACISWGRSSIFSLNRHLKSKFFGDQWSEETALVHLELCCVYLAKLELYLPKFPSLQSSGGIGVSLICIFCIRKGRNHQSSLLLCRCRKQGLCWSSPLLSAHLSPCGSLSCHRSFFHVSASRARWMMRCSWRLWGHQRPTHFCPLGFQLLFIVFYYRKNWMFVPENLEHTER